MQLQDTNYTKMKKERMTELSGYGLEDVILVMRIPAQSILYTRSFNLNRKTEETPCLTVSILCTQNSVTKKAEPECSAFF